jgi:hypothetical protein
MQLRQRLVSCLSACVFACVIVAGCASTKVSNREEYLGGQLPRPNHIWVYDFAATPGDIPPDSSLIGRFSPHGTPQSEQEIAVGRQVGADVAGYLIADIQAMGLPAERASSGTRPEVNDLVFRGYLLAVVKGSAVERVVIGFGKGASELTVAVEAFQMTDHGLRKLGSGDVASGGGKGPGAALPAAVAIATANPIGLAVGGAVKVYGEASGSSTIEGREKAAAKEIADTIQPKFEQQGWIE